MSVIRNEQQVAAGATVENLLADSPFEWVQRNSVVEVFCCCDNAAAIGTVLLDVFFGNVLVATNLAVPTFTATLGPDRDKHKLISHVAAAGDRISLKLRNTDANAVNLRYLVIISTI